MHPLSQYQLMGPTNGYIFCSGVVIVPASASQISTFNYQGVAENAYDGSPETIYWSGHCICTAHAHVNPWWVGYLGLYK